MARSGKTVSLYEGPLHLIDRFGTPGKLKIVLPDPASPSAPSTWCTNKAAMPS